MRRIGGAPTRPLFGGRVQIELHVGPGKHDRADVAAFHHDPAVQPHLALSRDEHRTHLRQTRDAPPRRDRFQASGWLRVTSSPSIVTRSRADFDRVTLGHRRKRALVVESDALAQRLPPDRPVHRAAVDVAIAKLGGDSSGHGAFTGARGPVDGDDEWFHEWTTDFGLSFVFSSFRG